MLISRSKGYSASLGTAGSRAARRPESGSANRRIALAALRSRCSRRTVGCANDGEAKTARTARTDKCVVIEDKTKHFRENPEQKDDSFSDSISQKLHFNARKDLVIFFS